MIRFISLIVSVMSLGVFTINRTPAPTTPTEVVSEVIEKDDFDTNILHVQFCGDTLPLHQSTVAKRYQKAVQFYDHPSFQRSRANTKKKMKQIENILKSHGIPSDFKYIPYIESAMNAGAVSPKGAAGYWQFMPATAQGLGLVVNDQIDERKDLVKSTKAAAKYLKWLYRELGNWTLVAAAYNAGPNKIIQRMDQQDKDSYFALHLNGETSKYVYRLVAVKEWINQPERSLEWSKVETISKVASYLKRKRDAADVAQALLIASAR
ncbi:lytic transglycosylase domain-containing protein [Salmonirosea aquatica]|uniref:Transglycosylase SLT domain-containing protein n=1 Tax=Salmonirosea aquatica TaxID=2654236 RepID=A0A7C9BS23_9BACT|nr:transglycosylase SLT domain-containing protein [Cytophagaceae bacterium SJW1-29]